MRLIKMLCADIASNIDEAKEKIRTAYEIRGTSSDAAAWYKDMASTHLGFNAAGHSAVKKMIDTYKDGEAYKRNPEYANGMMAAWEAVHNDLIERTAEVKAIIDGFK